MIVKTKFMSLTSFLTVLLTLSGIQLAKAQQVMNDTIPAASRSKGFRQENLFFGGGIGLSLGDYTYVNVSPLAGYRFSQYLAAGVNINLQYNSIRYRYYGSNELSQKSQYGIFGGGIFARIYPFQSLFIQINPEVNYLNGKTTYYNPTQTQSFHAVPLSLLMGGGYVQPIGGNASFSIMILYDVLQDKNSPYLNRPIYRGGVDIGF